MAVRPFLMPERGLFWTGHGMTEFSQLDFPYFGVCRGTSAVRRMRQDVRGRKPSAQATSSPRR